MVVSFFAVRCLSCLSFFFYLFISCDIEARARGRQERICPDVVRGGVTAVVVVSFIVVFGALFGVFFSIFSFCNSR